MNLNIKPCALLAALLLMNTIPALCRPAQEETLRLRILHTSDVHGHVLDALPRIAAYAEASRRLLGEDAVVLTDGGDVLQGHPAAYYYNYVDTAAGHLVAEAMNRAGYDLAVVGNHDIEAGRDVCRRWASQCRFPVLGANVVDAATGMPALKPYHVVERKGLRIAFLGMLTPAIPHWVPEQFRRGLRFDDIVASAARWVDVIRRTEQPDLVVALLHSGIEEAQGVRTADYVENEARLVAKQVPGVDLVLYGHDHRRHMERVEAPDGRSILCIGPTSTGACLCQVDVEVRRSRLTSRWADGPEAQGRYRILAVRTEGSLVEMDGGAPLSAANPAEADASRSGKKAGETWFPEAAAAVERYMNEEVGVFEHTVRERDAFFGPSEFIDLVHDLQLELSQGAQISFAAPLSFDAVIRAGMTRVSDMFALYKYENLLYTMRLTGREVRDFLEMSYDLWCNTMTSPDDHILLLDSVLDGGRRLGLKNMAFNFDAAAGICYTVDVSKPDGQKVNITALEDGTPFEMEREYLVATNSYRGNGGGELLTRGAGIPLSELPSRIVAATEHDLRYHLIQTIRQKGRIVPRKRTNWRFIPDEWAPEALRRDRMILFPDERNAR